VTVATPAPAGLWAAMAEATTVLEAAGVPSPRFDAEQLAASVLGTTRSGLRLVDAVGPEVLTAYSRVVERRAAREPLQHIVGTAAFRHVEAAVGPGVFVPRPETELVAGWAIDRARELAARGGAAPVVVDLCTGSGVIALAVADEVPSAVVHAVEVSPEAVAWARRNVEGTRVVLHAVDATTVAAPGGPLAGLAGCVDVVVTNPPYVPDDGRVRDPEVLAHDPAIALWGHGPDGLDVMRGVVRSAATLLTAGGWLVVEHADVQGKAVLDMLRGQGFWSDIADHKDLLGRDRFATARRADGPTRTEADA
jgi:release factor glutamine methyltransferase